MRQRTLNDENDENAAPVRLTRAKAAALGGPDEAGEAPVQKALQSKTKGTASIGGAPLQRKRAALGDLSNVVKNEVTNEKGAKTVSAATRPVLTNKAPSGGVQKVSRTSSTRSALGPKDVNGKRASTSDLKRPASGAGAVDRVQKKRSITSTHNHASVKAPSPPTENQQPAPVAVKVKQDTYVEKKETVTVDDVKPSVVIAEDQALDEPKVPDLDLDDCDDPIMVHEYAKEIFEYLRDLEETSRPNADYMDHQEHIDWQDRDILNNWLVEVHQKFSLLPETLYLTINIIDRFLSQKVVQLDKLQLVGITALFIASKYEEVISPHVSNFTYMAKDYKEEEVLSAERFILSTLNYDLSYPNPMNFLRRVSKADNYDIQTRTLAKYLLEISVLDHRFLDFTSSHVSAAAMYMARLILNRGPWVSTLGPSTP